MEDDPKKILESLQPLFEKARKEKLIFRCLYQGIDFFPDELEKKQKEGRFIWGPVNWELINPTKKLQKLKKDVLDASEEYDTFLSKLQKYLEN